MKQNRFIQGSLILLLLILNACVSQRDTVYLQERGNRIKEYSKTPYEEYKLQPRDELYIQISSFDEASATIFSSVSSAQSSLAVGSLQPYGASLAAYSIDKDGFLLIPVIGNVNVLGKTTMEVSQLLKDSLANILNQPIVSVKLVNRYISVLGEVRNPGHFAYSQEQITIFDALGLAGDITDYGDRSNIVLTRHSSDKNIRVSINITRSEILASEYYYLRPNDMLYVQPLKKKFWGMKEFPFNVVLSTISTALLIYTVVAK